jgi:peptidoglycan/LPS O-acetylase OafA/YrhL
MKRSLQLDGVRGVAIALVLVWHYFACELAVATPGRFLSRALVATRLAWSGVDLFFVLSGFLICGILLDHRDAPNFFRVFYARRVYRIFPLYFALVGAYFLARRTSLAHSPTFAWLLGSPLPSWSYATFSQNVLMGSRGDFGPHWLGVTWSLAVEEQFYLVIPLLVYLLDRRALVATFVMLILSAPLLRGVSTGIQSLVETPCRSDSLLAGGLLAVLVREPEFLAMVRRAHGAVLALLAALLFGTAVLTLRPGWFGVLDHSLLSGLHVVLVLLAFTESSPFLGRILSAAPLVWLGRVSYGVYMLHETVAGLLHGWIFGHVPQIRTGAEAGVTVLALVVTCILAEVSFRFFESPLLRRGHRVVYASSLDTSIARERYGLDAG